MRSALRIGEGRGVVLASAASVGARVVEIAPAAAKKAVVGSGQADKTQVARMVEAHLGLDAGLELPLDATDALALALAAVHRRLGVDRVRVPRSAALAEDGDPQEDRTPS